MQYSGTNDTEYIQLCKVFVENEQCFAKNCIHVGKFSTPLRIRIKPDDKLQTQRPTKVPIHHRDKLIAFLGDSQKN